jgi:hypothetical protein
VAGLVVEVDLVVEIWWWIWWKIIALKLIF